MINRGSEIKDSHIQESVQPVLWKERCSQMRVARF